MRPRFRLFLALIAVIVAGTTESASATAPPRATIMGFGFKSFRSPDVHKPVPAGTVRPGGALHGCSHQFHAYIAFRNMRPGLGFSLRLDLAPQVIDGQTVGIPPVIERFRWRFTSELTGRPIYPPDFHVGFPFGSSLSLSGHYTLTVAIAGHRGARGGITVVNTCGSTAEQTAAGRSSGQGT